MKLILAIMLLASSMHAQWQKIPVSTTASFRGLSVVDPNVVWASGTNGTVIRSVDGGKNWSVMTVPGAEKLDFRGIKAFDANTAVIISSGPAEQGQAKIFRTTDGGRNWKQVLEEKRNGFFFDTVAFWDKQHGIVLSDPVEGKFAFFNTDDGGVTWKQLSPADLPAALPKEGAFAASNSCLVVQGATNAWFATGGASVARVFHSGDRGKTWQVAETPLRPPNASSGIFSLAFKDEKNGIAASGDYLKPEGSELPNLMRTVDGGKTWQAIAPTNPPGIYFSSVAARSENIIAAAGIKGMCMSSVQWRDEPTENLNAVVVDGDAIWAVGPKGSVWRGLIGNDQATNQGCLVKHLPYFQLSQDNLRTLAKKILNIQIGDSRESVEAVLGKPDLDHTVRLKVQPFSRIRYLRYLVTRYEKDLDNDYFDEAIILAFDENDRLKSIRSSTPAVSNRP